MSLSFRWDEPSLFVIGTGRCGTTLLTDLIQGERIHCLKEREVKSRLRRLGRQHIFNLLYTGAFSEARFLRFFRATRKAEVRKLPAGHVYAEKIPHGQWALEPIRRVFPKARFIEISRDGRDTVQSMVSVGWYAPDDELPRWTPRGDLGAWSALPQFEKCCVRLARTIPFTLQNLLTEPGSGYLHFSYESLMADPEGILRRMEAFLGMPLARGVEIRPSREAWRAWTPAQLATYERILGPHGLAVQELLGYRRATPAELHARA
ncbi:MAG TPA: sulfotransferase [Planctomycetota bacterium]|nr:sulfotransferase [Planctomycetota bacterium]